MELTVILRITTIFAQIERGLQAKIAQFQANGAISGNFVNFD